MKEKTYKTGKRKKENSCLNRQHVQQKRLLKLKAQTGKNGPLQMGVVLRTKKMDLFHKIQSTICHRKYQELIKEGIVEKYISNSLFGKMLTSPLEARRHLPMVYYPIINIIK